MLFVSVSHAKQPQRWAIHLINEETAGFALFPSRAVPLSLSLWKGCTFNKAVQIGCRDTAGWLAGWLDIQIPIPWRGLGLGCVRALSLWHAPIVNLDQHIWAMFAQRCPAGLPVDWKKWPAVASTLASASLCPLTPALTRPMQIFSKWISALWLLSFMSVPVVLSDSHTSTQRVHYPPLPPPSLLLDRRQRICQFVAMTVNRQAAGSEGFSFSFCYSFGSGFGFMATLAKGVR